MFAILIKYVQINTPIKVVLNGKKEGGGRGGSKHLDAIYCRTTETQFIKFC